MARSCVRVLIAWLLIYSHSLAGASGYPELVHGLRHRSPAEIIVPEVEAPPEAGPVGGANPDAGNPDAGNPNVDDPNKPPEPLGETGCSECSDGPLTSGALTEPEQPQSLDSPSKDDFMKKLDDWADALKECLQLLIPSGSDSSYTGTTCSDFAASCPTSIFNTTDLDAMYANMSMSTSNTTSSGPYSFPNLNDDVDNKCGHLQISKNIAKAACHDADVLQCIQGVSQGYQDWYSWVSLSCKGVDTSNSTNTGPTIPTGTSNMVMSTSSRIATRTLNLVVPLLLSIIFSISDG